MDILINGWLLYQTLGSRVLGRTAFYQSSGAYGYRDQLQDVMALCVSSPGTTREHIFKGRRAAVRRRRCAALVAAHVGPGNQDAGVGRWLWLPFVVAHYLEVSGDVVRAGRAGALLARAGRLL